MSHAGIEENLFSLRRLRLYIVDDSIINIISFSYRMNKLYFFANCLRGCCFSSQKRILYAIASIYRLFVRQRQTW